MTAAEQHPADPTWNTYCTARDHYARAHRHQWPTDQLALNAQRAGLHAARDDWERHPDHSEDTSDLILTASCAEKNRLISIGWIPLGASTWYVLAPPPTNPPHPVDRRP